GIVGNGVLGNRRRVRAAVHDLASLHGCAEHDRNEVPGRLITTDPALLALPFAGIWKAQNSPARRVPSHGVDVFGERYAIDFVAVDARGSSARVRAWRTAVATEPPERFIGFGRPVHAGWRVRLHRAPAGRVVPRHRG